MYYAILYSYSSMHILGCTGVKFVYIRQNFMHTCALGIKDKKMKRKIMLNVARCF